MNWHKDLAMAGSTSAVLDLVNEFLQQMADDPRIPTPLRPRPVESAGDVQRWHHTLSDAVADLDKPNLALQDLCVVFVRASARLAELSREYPANGDANAASG